MSILVSIEKMQYCGIIFGIWKCNNSPRVGTLADISNSTHAKYHIALRFIKNNEEMCVSNKLADTIVNNRSTEFWSEMKCIRSVRSSRPTMIDGDREPTQKTFL